jgi:hypothetical protein
MVKAECLLCVKILIIYFYFGEEQFMPFPCSCQALTCLVESCLDVCYCTVLRFVQFSE